MQLRAMLFAIFSLFAAVLGQVSDTGDEAPLELTHISQVYLPYAFVDAEPQFCYGKGAAKAMNYQPQDNLVYIVGESSLLQIVNISNVEKPDLVYRMSINTPGSAIASCDGMIAVAALNFWNPAGIGNILIYTQYDDTIESMTWRYNLTVGATPVDMAFTPDCSKLIVANQGFHGLDRGDFYSNPVGSVSVIEFLPLKEEMTPAEADELVTTFNFSSFDDMADELVQQGVRWVYKGQFTPDSVPQEYLSNDLEPTKLVITQDGKTVYIFMQKNNAVAVMDINTGDISSILALGSKSFEDYPIDASSVDGGAFLSSYPISGLYQPAFVVPATGADGELYLISANTGMDTSLTKEVNGVFNSFQDYEMGENLAADFDGDLADLLEEPVFLGDMKFSLVDDGLVTFGARSFSVWNLANLTVVFDSGYFLEQRHKTHLLSVFNTMTAEGFCLVESDYQGLAPTVDKIFEEIIDTNTVNVTMLELVDDLEEDGVGPEPVYVNVTSEQYVGPDAITEGPRSMQDIASSSVGPQPSLIATAMIGNTNVMILATKGSSSLFVFDITDPLAPVWHSASVFGDVEGTYYDLYESKALGDIEPTSMAIITGEDSPTGETLVLVTGGKSSTFSIYSLAPMATGSWIATEESSEANFITAETFDAEPVPATEETVGRGTVSDLTLGVCQDIAPDDELTCAQQKSFGKCEEMFMIEGNLCARSCQRLPCNQGGVIESVSFLKNTTYITVNPFLAEEEVAETLTSGVLSGYSCVGRGSNEQCSDLPAAFSGLSGPIESSGVHQSFIAISDRGPNQDCGDLADAGVATVFQGGKGFPVPAFSPFISKVTVNPETSTVIMEDSCYFKGTDGSAVTGISSSINDDNPHGKDCVEDLDYNPSGLDSEDIYPIGSTGLCLAVEEYSPSVVVVNCEFGTDACGTVLMRYTPEGVLLDGASYPVKDNLPAIYSRRRKNRGFEGVAVSPSGTYAYVFVQSTMGSDEVDSMYRDSRTIRALKMNITDPLNAEVVSEYVYLGDAPEFWTVSTNIPRDIKLSAALWLGDDESKDVLVLERAKGQVKLYITNFSNATNILDMPESSTLFWEDIRNAYVMRDVYQPVVKTLLLDSAQVEGWDGEIVTYKQEGVGIVNDCTVIMGADNDFGLEGSGPSTTTVIRMQQCISELIAVAIL
eukprot:TRINITY_DN441_c0_g1_i3.p1 TRINITY_DN441_c0_g1~~TRINITY_DN441_c0_g1_i3.p1  ORF type:complete len:1169 (-),score=245.25 TRINITY_DN441_c0_g1_i3:240-3746(-)